MKYLLVLTISWIAYGIAGLFGFQRIPKEFRGRKWTKRYIRQRGISWLMIGIPWLILYCVDAVREIPVGLGMVLIVACGLPAIIYSAYIDRKSRALLKAEEA